MRSLLIVLCSLCFLSFCEIDLYRLEERGSSKVDIPDNDTSSIIVDLGGEPSAIVQGCVNIITGSFCDANTDLTLPGIVPLKLERFYSSSHAIGARGVRGSLCHSWNLNYGGEIEIKAGTELTQACVKSADGLEIDYYSYGKHKNKLWLSTKTCLRGLTNCAFGLISGRTNLKNSYINYDDKTRACTLVKGSGVMQWYDPVGDKYDRTFCLKGEHLPSGNSLLYEYDAKKRLQKIRATNCEGSNFAEVSLRYSENEVNVIASDGRTVDYQFEKKHGESFLARVTRSDGPDESYVYEERNPYHTARLACKHRPDHRYLAVAYDSLDRVQHLIAPVGVDAAPHITHEFRYFYSNPALNDGVKTVTHVIDILGNKKEYVCNKDDRLVGTVTYAGDQPYSVVRNSWGDNDSPYHRTNLLSRRVEDAAGNILCCRYLHYDKQGNVVAEQLWGNLSGHRANHPYVHVDQHNIPIADGCEFYQKNYRYSEDGYNLLLEERDSRKTTLYGYYPNTDLLAYSFVCSDSTIQLRHFYEYNANGCLIKEITDDGHTAFKEHISDVSERKIVYTDPTGPYCLPKTVDEVYLDLSNQTERLLRRTCNEYSQEGWLLEKKIYDQNLTLAAVWKYNYDSKGHVIYEENPLQEAIERKYDANGNLILERHLSYDYTKEYSYDYSNRLIAVKEIYDGEEYTTRHHYNGLHQRYATTDRYGNTTEFTYDHCGRLIQTTYPFVYNEDGISMRPVESTTYDVLGNPTSTTNPGGHTKYTLHNIRGQPLHSIYPDRTEEKYYYTDDGLPNIHISKEGIQTFLTYDYQGRLLSKALFSGKNLLQTTSSTYNAFHLLTETDEAGQTTYYSYDHAGRLSDKRKGKTHTHYEYDTLGRTHRIQEYANEHEYTAQILHYDALDRIIEENIEDTSGRLVSSICYQYDAKGNRTHTKTQAQSGESCEKIQYNALNQPVLYLTPEGNSTQIFYIPVYNELGQVVASEQSVDPLGNTNITIYDALGRIAIFQRKDPMGNIVQKQRIFYDLAGNKRIVQDSVLRPGEEFLYITAWEYNSACQVTKTIEAYGSAQPKTTQHHYNALGQLITTTKPNGVQLHYAYDCLGRLFRIASSDLTVDYTYAYDANSNPIQVKSPHGTTYRTYDEHDWLIEETLEHGLKLGYQYNAKGELIQLTLPDQSQIAYEYQGNLLSAIKRYTSDHTLSYAHTYLYDQRKLPTQMHLLKNAGTLHIAYNLDGRETARNCAQQTQKMSYDPAGRIVLKELGSNSNYFTYDALSQLTAEKGPHENAYTYDSLYNRLSKNETAYQINHLQQLTYDGQAQYIYDASGNLLEKKTPTATFSYSYDALDRLLSVSEGENLTTYTYDFENRRLTKQTGTETNRFIYLGQNEIGALDENHTINQLRVLGIGKGAEIGASVAIELQGQVYAPLHDESGHIVALLDGSGALFEEYSYSAFGEERIFDHNGNQKSHAYNPWRFASKRFDSETGWVYFGRRYYAPEQGRWVTADPAGFLDGSNLYAYVHNNPTNLFDLYGLFSLVDIPKEIDYSNGLRDGDFKTNELPEVCYFHYFEHMCPFYDRSRLYSVGDRSIDNLGIGFVNGIWNDFAGSKSGAEYLSRLADGYKIHAVFNATHGDREDLGECILGLCFIATTPVELIHKMWDNFFENKSADARFLTVCHSQGAIHTRNALIDYDRELRRKISVVAIAPAAYIFQQTCAQVTHYRNALGLRDFVPRVDFLGARREAHTIVNLTSHPNAPLFDHEFQSPTYREALALELHDFLNGGKK